jgi:hypothetical protein
MSTTTITANPKRYTRDQIMAMARYEYARQLSIYTRAQLTKGQSQSSSTSTSAAAAAAAATSTTNTARMIC